MNRILSPRNIMIILLGASLFLPNLAHAYLQENQEQRQFVNPGHLIDLFDLFFDLNLTEEQIKALEELTVETRNKIKPLRDEIKELRVQMNETFLGKDIDTEKTSDQIEEMVELRLKISKTYLNAKLEGVQILTPEQRTIILEKKKEWRDRFKNLMNPLKLFFK